MAEKKLKKYAQSIKVNGPGPGNLKPPSPNATLAPIKTKIATVPITQIEEWVEEIINQMCELEACDAEIQAQVVTLPPKIYRFIDAYCASGCNCYPGSVEAWLKSMHINLVISHEKITEIGVF